MPEFLHGTKPNIEQLIPRTGVETVPISDAEGQANFAVIPLESEPLFEVGGIKALAEIKIAFEPDSPTETYYVVDVSAKGYDRIERGIKEKIDYLVVNEAFFDTKESQRDRSNFASLRKPQGEYEGPSSTVGGKSHNTRFNKQGAANSFRARIVGNHEPYLAIGRSEYETQGFEVKYKRDNSDPAQFIKTHREQKAVGEALSPVEHEQKGKSIRARFMETVKRNFTRSRYSDFHYDDDNEMKYEPTRGDYKDVYDEVNFHDLEVLDDQFGLRPENAEQVGNALQLIENQERQEAVTTVTEHLHKTRFRKALGLTAVAAAQMTVLYLDHKIGGPISEGKNSDANGITVLAEGVGFALGLQKANSFSWALASIHRMLKKGVDTLIPDNAPRKFDSDVTEPELIRDIAKKHEKFLYELDKSVHDMQRKYEY